jgi:hypothetical protein
MKSFILNYQGIFVFLKDYWIIMGLLDYFEIIGLSRDLRIFKGLLDF